MKAPKLSLLFFLVTTIGFSQSDFKEYYTKFDRVVGLKNTKLSYGILYKENYITLKENLFKKHLKKKKKKTDQSFMYYKFIKESRYVIYYKNAYFKGNKKKDLVKVFPKQKNFIDSYYKTNKEMKKNNFDAFLTQFIQMLSTKLEEVCCN